jgi:iron(III) transport system permease protein
MTSTMPTQKAPSALRGVSLVLAAAFSFPGLYLIWRNISTGADPLGLLTSQRTLAPLWRTLKLAVTVSLSAAIIGTALAWLTMRTDIPLRRTWRTVLPLPLVFPTFIGAAAFIRTLNPGGLANGLFNSIGIQQAPELRGFLVPGSS